MFRKLYLFFILFFSNAIFSQVSKPDFYREDQFYFGSSYFIQTEPIENFKQNGFSGNFQFGFVRDLPLNNNSTNTVNQIYNGGLMFGLLLFDLCLIIRCVIYRSNYEYGINRQIEAINNEIYNYNYNTNIQAKAQIIILSQT